MTPTDGSPIGWLRTICWGWNRTKSSFGIQFYSLGKQGCSGSGRSFFWYSNRCDFLLKLQQICNGFLIKIRSYLFFNWYSANSNQRCYSCKTTQGGATNTSWHYLKRSIWQFKMSQVALLWLSYDTFSHCLCFRLRTGVTLKSLGSLAQRVSVFVLHWRIFGVSIRFFTLWISPKIISFQFIYFYILHSFMIAMLLWNTVNTSKVSLSIWSLLRHWPGMMDYEQALHHHFLCHLGTRSQTCSM